MANKKFWLGILVLVCAGAVFAQETASAEKKNAIALDMIPLFKGFIAGDSDAKTSFFCISAAYERLIAPHYSIGVELDLYPGKIWDVKYTYFGMALAGRFYPMSEGMEKFFIGTSLGFNTQRIDGESKREYGGFSGIFISMKTGYKIMLGDRFFIEPSMSYTYSKTNADLFGSTPQNIGWQAGLRLGFSL